MEIINDINVIYLLAFSNALILFATAAVVRGDSRAEDRKARQAREADREAMTRLLLKRLEKIDRRLDSIEQTSTELAGRPQAAPQQSFGNVHRYGEALRMVNGGASPADLVSRCGLSRGEADLIVRLHGNRHRGGTRPNLRPI